MQPLCNKYTNWYFNIINECKSNPPKTAYTERHHIIPRSLGGSDNADNIVTLTAKQHFICHLLLTKMFKSGTSEYYKMLHAFCMMDWCSSDKQKRYTSRVHEKQRQEYSKYMKLKQAGEGNNQFGTCWIYNEELKECKKVSKSDDIPDGWQRGRVMNWDKHFDRLESQCALINTHCERCNKIFKPQKKCQRFCSRKCSQAWHHNNAKLVIIYKGDQIKEIKANYVPSYKLHGWVTK